MTQTRIKNVARALGRAQAEFLPIKRTATGVISSKGDAREYRYAELSDVIDATRPALTRHGLTVTQQSELAGNEIKVRTRLIHHSGEYLEEVLPLPIPDSYNRIQAIGSAITYGRRYGLSLVLGVASEDDLDSPMETSPQPAQRPANRPAQKPKDPDPVSTNFDKEYPLLLSDVIEITGTIKSPKWTHPELLDIDADKLKEQSIKEKNVLPMLILKLRAKAADPFRGHPDWLARVREIMALGMDPAKLLGHISENRQA